MTLRSKKNKRGGSGFVKRLIGQIGRAPDKWHGELEFFDFLPEKNDGGGCASSANDARGCTRGRLRTCCRGVAA
eukprot:4157698-Pleurochrysis_carterae.AAC.2